jgi:hypothetical protein
MGDLAPIQLLTCEAVPDTLSWPSSRKSHLKSTPCPLLLTPTFAVFSHRIHTLPLTKRSQPLVLTVPLPSSSLTLYSRNLFIFSQEIGFESSLDDDRELSPYRLSKISARLGPPTQPENCGVPSRPTAVSFCTALSPTKRPGPLQPCAREIKTFGFT